MSKKDTETKEMLLELVESLQKGIEDLYKDRNRLQEKLTDARMSAEQESAGLLKENDQLRADLAAAKSKEGLLDEVYVKSGIVPIPKKTYDYVMGLIEELIAVEKLEYHNRNWLFGDVESRSRRFQETLWDIKEGLEFKGEHYVKKEENDE